MGRVVLLCGDDPPHWIHELGHWLAATPERRRGLNYSSSGDDAQPADVEGDVCSLDVFLLERLCGRDMSCQWWDVVRGDVAYEPMRDHGRRLWRRITGRKGPGRMLAAEPLVGLSATVDGYLWEDDDQRRRVMLAVERVNASR